MSRGAGIAARVVDPEASTTPMVQLLRDAVQQGVTAGAAVAWGRLGQPLQVAVAGATAWPGQGVPVRPVTPTTLFDLASLTKPLVTTLAALLLVSSARIRLDDPVSRWLTGWTHGRRGRVLIRHLLAHEAGLPWWLPWHLELAREEPGQRWARVRDQLLALEPASEPGAACTYSDPGFVLLGWLLAEAAGEPPLQLVQRCWRAWRAAPVYVTLDPILHPPGPGCVTRAELFASSQDGIAATERCPWRGRVLLGEVHDENAHFLGGVAAHAGLFGTAVDVARIGLGLLAVRLGRADCAVPLDGSVVEAFWQGGTRPGGATWALGWDTPTPGTSSGGRRISPGAVGHLGFTGTSLWIDPSREAVIALLTNRVHPSRTDERIKQLRPAVHDLLWQMLEQF